MLTETRSDGSWSVSGIDFKDCKGNMYGALCRLRDYEKTGLNPEDFRSDSYEKKYMYCGGCTSKFHQSGPPFASYP